MSDWLKYCARESSIPEGATNIHKIWGSTRSGHQTRWNEHLDIAWGYSFVPPIGYRRVTKLDKDMKNPLKNTRKWYDSLSSFMEYYSDEFTIDEINEQIQKEKDVVHDTYIDSLTMRQEDEQWIINVKNEEWERSTGQFIDDDEKWWNESGKYIYSPKDPEWEQYYGGPVTTTKGNENEIDVDVEPYDDSDLSDYDDY